MGGAYGSSHEAVTFDGKVIKGGKDYWIWPAGHGVDSPRPDGTGGASVVELNWHLQPGGKPVTGGTVYGTLECAP